MVRRPASRNHRWKKTPDYGAQKRTAVSRAPLRQIGFRGVANDCRSSPQSGDERNSRARPFANPARRIASPGGRDGASSPGIAGENHDRERDLENWRRGFAEINLALDHPRFSARKPLRAEFCRSEE